MPARDFWTEQMLKGNFEEAWKFCDNVLRERKNTPCWHLPRHQQWVWNGESLDNKRVLIRCYHGLGDTIQFIRYAKLVKQIASEVIVWAQPELISLLQTVEGIDKLIPLHDGSPEIEYDIDVEIMELPHVFRSTLHSLPATIPYIHVPPLYLSNNNEEAAVGIMWKVGEWDSSRSIPFELLKPLFNTKGIRFYILQTDPQHAGWQPQYGVYPGSFSLYDFARVVKGLDLVITVDAMPSHIAASQGIPAWVLLQHQSDWRWMENRNDSPWYPDVKLFRQRYPGDWNAVVKNVSDELEKLKTTKQVTM